jgi:hypothetical protein
MKRNELSQNLPIQTYKFKKYDFIIKQEFYEGKQWYSLNGYRRNHKNTFIISKWEDKSLYPRLEDVMELINYLVNDKIF